MNMNRLINMVMRLFLRKAVNGGINAGMKRMSGGKGRRGGQGAGAQVQQQTPADAPPPMQNKQAMRKARQAARAARRARKM